MKTYGGILFFIISMLACSLRNLNNDNPHLEVLEATSQAWVAGVRGGGRGINYRISLKINTTESIKFDSIWVDGKRFETKPEKDDKIILAKNAVVVLVASDYTSIQDKKGNKAEEKVVGSSIDSIRAPIDYQGAALLRYFVDDSIQYITVATITVLPTEYRQ